MKSVSWALVALGMSQMVGFATGLDGLRLAGRASAAAPFPQVFFDADGLEPFASVGQLEWATADGQRRITPITSQLVAAMDGPFHRAHTYAGLIGYAPRHPERLWRSVLHVGLCGQGPLARAAGLTEPVQTATLHMATTTAGRNDAWSFVIACSP
jgi:hypothetical protein